MERGKERGLTTGKPWLKVNPNYIQVNAAEEETDAASVLQYYRQLIALRKSDSYREAFTYGEFRPAFEDEKVFSLLPAARRNRKSWLRQIMGPGNRYWSCLPG